MLFSSGRKVLNCSLPLDEFGRSCFFFREESLLFVLFVAPRRVWNIVLFSSGRKVFYCICCCGSTSLERCAIFLREKDLIIAQLDILFDLPPLDEFGTSCCLLKGKHSSICIVVVTQQNLERRINFPPLDELELCAGFLRTKRISK